MHHAIGAFLVIAGAVGVPVGLLHQLLEAAGIAFAEQVAGPLPAKIIAARAAPRRAVTSLVSGEEVEEEARLVELPARLSRFLRVTAEDVAEQLLGPSPVEEMFLVGRALI